MGQKTSAISQRLHLNRQPDSSWYSDYHYSKLLAIDLNWRHYLDSIHTTKAQRTPKLTKTDFRKSGKVHSRTILHFLPKATLVHLCMLGRPNKTKKTVLYKKRAYKLGKFRIARIRQGINTTPQYNTPVFCYHRERLRTSPKQKLYLTRMTKHASPLDMFAMLYLRDKVISMQPTSIVHKLKLLCYTLQHARLDRKSTFFEPFYTNRLHNRIPVHAPNVVQLEGSLPTVSVHHRVGAEHRLVSAPNGGAYSRTQVLLSPYKFFVLSSCSSVKLLNGFNVKPCFQSIQSVLETHTKTICNHAALQFQHVYMSAGFVAKEIGLRLQQRASFGSICRQLFLKAKQHSYVEGIRVSCSGRIRGAEIARTELKKFGQTSLHVFRNHIDYAKLRVNTKYGVLGVKVWISYKPKIS